MILIATARNNLMDWSSSIEGAQWLSKLNLKNWVILTFLNKKERIIYYT